MLGVNDCNVAMFGPWAVASELGVEKFDVLVSSGMVTCGAGDLV
jgi:hypothetical protein